MFVEIHSSWKPEEIVFTTIEVVTYELITHDFQKTKLIDTEEGSLLHY